MPLNPEPLTYKDLQESEYQYDKLWVEKDEEIICILPKYHDDGFISFVCSGYYGIAFRPTQEFYTTFFCCCQSVVYKHWNKNDNHTV